VLPLLLGGPLVLRRREPLLMWLAIWAGIALLCLVADNSVRGLAFMFVLFAAAYSLGAHASLRHAVVGLVLTAPVVAVISHRGELALAFSQGRQASSATAGSRRRGVGKAGRAIPREDREQRPAGTGRD
jgi:hypothetical protein